MMKRFAKVDLESLDARLRRLVGELRQANAGGDGAASEGATSQSPYEAMMAELVHAVAPDVIANGARLVNAQLPAELGTAPARAALHEVRIEAKKLRYVLEILTPDLGSAGRRRERRLRQWLSATR